MKKLISSRLAAAAFMLVVMALSSAIGAVVPLLLPGLYTPLKVLLQWIALPLLGGFTAGVLARAGVSHYIAWMPPPIVVSALPWMLIGYPLAPAVMLLCCLVSMIGASAGAVLRRRANAGQAE